MRKEGKGRRGDDKRKGGGGVEEEIRGGRGREDEGG